MYSGHHPFNIASELDEAYKDIMENKHDKFWHYHSLSKPEGYYSDKFKTLVSRLFE
jgi:hypothetical protein